MELERCAARQHLPISFFSFLKRNEEFTLYMVFSLYFCIAEVF